MTVQGDEGGVVERLAALFVCVKDGSPQGGDAFGSVLRTTARLSRATRGRDVRIQS
jgi:hypothetical protein